MGGGGVAGKSGEGEVRWGRGGGIGFADRGFRDWHPAMAAKMKPSSPTFSIEPRIRINYGRGVGFGPGKAELLAHIDLTGSISEAAKAMEMSYMRAWTLVKSMERGFCEPLVLKVRGGNARGGAMLSETGRAVLALYKEMELKSSEAMSEAGERFLKLLGR